MVRDLVFRCEQTWTTDRLAKLNINMISCIEFRKGRPYVRKETTRSCFTRFYFSHSINIKTNLKTIFDTFFS